MSSPNTPSNSANEEDPWEQLADLVGIEGGKEYVAGSVPAAEDALTPAPAQRAAEPPPVVAAPPAPVWDTPSDPPSPPMMESAGEFTAADAASDDSSVESPTPSAPTTSTSAQDSYWDALANWNWDDSEGPGRAKPDLSRTASDAPAPDRPERGGPSRGEPRRGRDDRRERRGGDRPPRSSTSPAPRSPEPPARTPRTPSPAAGDDFGLGITSESADQSSPDERRDEDVAPPVREGSRPESAAPRDGDRARGGERRADDRGEGDFPRKRRRRRRRRGRGGEPAEATPASLAAGEAAPGADWDDSAGPESDFVDEPEQPAASPQATDDQEPDDRSNRPPRDRNRDRRREGAPRRGASEKIDDRFDDDSDEHQEITAGGGAAEPIDSEADDETGEPAASYENVPTWEEAISYLLHPSQVQVEPGAGNGTGPPRSPAPTDQPRQTRHVGNRKHRR